MSVAQVALFVDTTGGPLALMASMVTAALWFPSFLRGRQLAQQMRLARDVQQLLLPAAFPAGSEVDIAATCVPAWDVGGDCYDVFHARGGDVIPVLADVAGKGVAAENVQGEEFGDDRLISTVEEGRRGPAAEILQHVLSAIHHFADRQPFRDDVTLLAAKIR